MSYSDAPLAFLDIRLAGAVEIFTAASTGIPLGCGIIASCISVCC